MGTKNTIPTRVDKKFMREIEEMKLTRLRLGKDNPLKPTNNSRITLAMVRHPLFSKIKLDIIKANLT